MLSSTVALRLPLRTARLSLLSNHPLSLDETAAMKAFYDQYGFAVVRDVLTEAECEATREEIWDYVEESSSSGAGSGKGSVSRHDVTTWANWKTKSFGPSKA